LKSNEIQLKNKNPEKLKLLSFYLIDDGSRPRQDVLILTENKKTWTERESNPGLPFKATSNDSLFLALFFI